MKGAQVMPEPGSSPPQITLSVVDGHSRPATVDIAIGLESVEIRCNDTPVAIHDRAEFAAWLERPSANFTAGTVVWLWTGHQHRLWIRHRIPAHPVPAHVVHDLRRRLDPGPRP